MAKRKRTPRREKINMDADVKSYVYQRVNPISLFKREYCDRLVAHCAQGFSYESFAAIAQVSAMTLYHWEREYMEWRDAKDRAQAAGLYAWEKFGISGINALPVKHGGVTVKRDGKFSASGYAFFTTNRYRKFFNSGGINASDAMEILSDDDTKISDKTNDPIKAAQIYEELIRG